MDSTQTHIVIIGGVAAGATAAARARRIDENAHITIIERGPYVSFANCGLPYFISRDIPKRSSLILQTPEGFLARYNVEVLLKHEAVSIDRAGKTVSVQSPSGMKSIPYDKLILAQGGNPVIPRIPGADAEHVFKVWTIPDMDAIHRFIDEKKPETAVVVGGGFIGLEMAEAFHARGIHTTIVELTGHLMPIMDTEFGRQIQNAFEEGGIQVRTSCSVESILPQTKDILLSGGERIKADIVLLSVGVSPETKLAREAGLSIGGSGGILVDNHLRTSDPDIYAAGDMIETVQIVSGKKVRVPLAGPANRQGRIAASNALGMNMEYKGALGTSIVKVLSYTAGITGLSEQAAKKEGFDTGVAIVHRNNHASYYPGAESISLKIVYDRKSGRLLGCEAFGKAGVDKRIDVCATAIQGGLTVSDLSELDLAYAPPYSSANDPLNMAAFVAMNHMSGMSPVATAEEVREAIKAGDALILDVRTYGEYAKGHVAGSLHIPVDELRDRCGEVPAKKALFLCSKDGFEGHIALRILMQSGFSNVKNITGGYKSIELIGGYSIESDSGSF
ncbi:MAG TPA: FAD-dependent oxidoreductase [Spirochaetia bacterium]|nr:FAD-dependent oxidoreductase [Spirochaetia bacterium]